MIVRKATQVGNRVIRTRAKEVSKPTSKETRKIIKDLTDSMRHHGLVGMAAPQIGKGLRIFVTEIRKTKFRKSIVNKNVDSLRVFINPKIVSFSKKQGRGWEGCGSVASGGLFGMVKRPSSLVVEALNERGEKFTLAAKNLLARVIQHEIDHLNGIVFVDKADTKTYTGRDEYLRLRKKTG